MNSEENERYLTKNASINDDIFVWRILVNDNHTESEQHSISFEQDPCMLENRIFKLLPHYCMHFQATWQFIIVDLNPYAYII